VILESPEANCLKQEIMPLCRHCRDGNYTLCENSSLGRGPRGMGGGWGDSFTVHATGVYRVPDELDDETALMIEPLSVGVRTALRCLPHPEQRVLVVGCGIVLALCGSHAGAAKAQLRLRRRRLGSHRPGYLRPPDARGFRVPFLPGRPQGQGQNPLPPDPRVSLQI